MARGAARSTAGRRGVCILKNREALIPPTRAPRGDLGLRRCRCAIRMRQRGVIISNKERGAAGQKQAKEREPGGGIVRKKRKKLEIDPSSAISSSSPLVLSKYERSRLISHRVAELERNAPLVPLPPSGGEEEIIDRGPSGRETRRSMRRRSREAELSGGDEKLSLFQIASREVDERALDVSVRRFLPGGLTSVHHLSDFPQIKIATFS